MGDNEMLNYIKEVLENMPGDWLNLTTHRLDIYDEAQAKTQFLDAFESLFHSKNVQSSALKELPTAYDYIRLGHPLSCVLEWAVAKIHGLEPKNVVSFSSDSPYTSCFTEESIRTKKYTHCIYE